MTLNRNLTESICGSIDEIDRKESAYKLFMT